MNHNKTNQPDQSVPLNEQHLELAKLAAKGDTAARAEVNHLAHPIIGFQTKQFCKRFCRENRFRYICTLTDSAAIPPRDAVLCEWGNASYAWMLDDLTGAGRLLQYAGTNGARLNDYFYHIANSLPFYERWKDWRFGRRVHVPTYIKELFPEAGRIFFALRAGDNVAEIAQKLSRAEAQVEEMCQTVIMVLSQRKKLHLLDVPVTVSLTGDQPDEQDTETAQCDIPSYDEAPEQLEQRHRLAEAWAGLSPVEQYVIEAMVLDEQDATDVLRALQAMGISIKVGVSPEDTNRQQLYYFRRKTLARLAELLGKI